MTQIVTVNGLVDAQTLGPTMMHEHLLIDLYRISRDANGRLSESDLATQEAAKFAAAGGGTIVDVTTADLGRDAVALREISAATGLNIVMGCGWYREPWYPAEIRYRSTAELTESLVEEIRCGVGQSGVRPGIIGELGTDQDYVSPSEERVFRAGARAHLESGLTITTHALSSAVGIDQLALLEEEGVPAERVIIGHCDSYPHIDYHERLLQRGAWVQFDLIRRDVEWEVEKRVRLICELVRRGHIRKLLLSQDVCRKSHLLAYGGGGYAYLLADFADRLAQAGLSRDELQVLMEDNPRRALCGEN